MFSDEAKNYKHAKGDSWGLLAAMLVLMTFMVIYYVKEKTIFYPLLAICFAYSGLDYLGRYAANKEKLDLAMAIAGILIFLRNFILGLGYLWKF